MYASPAVRSAHPEDPPKYLEEQSSVDFPQMWIRVCVTRHPVWRCSMEIAPPQEPPRALHSGYNAPQNQVILLTRYTIFVILLVRVKFVERYEKHRMVSCRPQNIPLAPRVPTRLCGSYLREVSGPSCSSHNSGLLVLRRLLFFLRLLRKDKRR